ncbi:hypothetical protein CRI77_00800 [Mycolicibacterium duvalii]|uniref:Uncharacterized protein n=1 Tax=Mycolicibacterium duvalii TaxID=39688 RepID=A0A7I7K6R2_9MYCO|nr:hypothetical protein [Mycolicibacterium duvalii]MCV7368941.1 hypothetical protein [Mycolicibacterium duvalii]PEG44427.1 hypothetical protein CRI77_00800 [Mycolicibacterium duvalii]BBX19161.1 hypothetical protein MDUV_40210 [Mycolicibacterium duvalii]
MSVTGRTRSLARTGLKVQRRVALAQMLFWPAVLATAGVLGAGVVMARRRNNQSQSTAPDLAAPDPAAAVS